MAYGEGHDGHEAQQAAARGPHGPWEHRADGLDREIETLDEFDQVILGGTLSGFRVQSVDLTGRTLALLSTDTSETVFLGCPMAPDAAAKIRADGALVFLPSRTSPSTRTGACSTRPSISSKGWTRAGTR